MWRKLLTFAAAASLALCVASVVLWARTSGRWEYANWAGPRHDLSYYSWSGVVGLSGTVGTGPDRPGPRRAHHRGANPGYSRALSPVQPGPAPSGFGAHVTPTAGPPVGNWRVGGWPVVSLFAPWWFVVAVTAALPAWRLWRRASARRRQRHSLCPACGYDRRASPGRCPECGTPA